MSGVYPGTVDDLQDFYRETILEHSHRPVGFNKAIHSTYRNEQFNPLCGDHIILSLQLDDGRVIDAAFEGEACAICKASASLLCQQAPGRSMMELTETKQWLESTLAGSGAAEEHPELQALLGVSAYPSRIQCALLPWKALESAPTEAPVLSACESGRER